MSVDERAHFDAIATAVQSAGVLYERGKVPGLDGAPGVEPSEYLILDLSRTIASTRRQNGSTGRTAWRAAVRVAAMTARNARALQAEANALLDDVTVTVDGQTSTAWTFESGRAISRSGTRYEGAWTWTYVL